MTKSAALLALVMIGTTAFAQGKGPAKQTSAASNSQFMMKVGTNIPEQAGQTEDIWASGCNGRIEGMNEGDKLVILVQDCGKQSLLLSDSEKTAYKMPQTGPNLLKDFDPDGQVFRANPEIKIEKLEQKPGEKVAGRATTYYRFRATFKPDPVLTKTDVLFTIDDEFWADPTLKSGAADDLMGKSPEGAQYQKIREAYAVIKGVPLRHKTVVSLQRGEHVNKQPEFVQEAVEVVVKPFPVSMLQVPKGYAVKDMPPPDQQQQ